MLELVVNIVPGFAYDSDVLPLPCLLLTLCNNDGIYLNSDSQMHNLDVLILIGKVHLFRLLPLYIIVHQT